MNPFRVKNGIRYALFHVGRFPLIVLRSKVLERQLAISFCVL